jgi:hypothetical protein
LPCDLSGDSGVRCMPGMCIASSPHPHAQPCAQAQLILVEEKCQLENVWWGDLFGMRSGASARIASYLYLFLINARTSSNTVRSTFQTRSPRKSKGLVAPYLSNLVICQTLPIDRPHRLLDLIGYETSP